MSENRMICGLREIGKFLGRSERWMCDRRRTMRECGVIFRQWRGKPPQKIWCAWTDDLIRYTKIEGQALEEEE